MYLPTVQPIWPAPAWVRTATTTRAGGVSRPPFDTLNLSGDVEDAPAAVAENRARLVSGLGLPEAPRWMRQVHGTRVADARAVAGDTEADAVVADRPGLVCSVLTADCIPVVLCDRLGTRVATAHAGWRGLAAGVIEATVAAMQTEPDRLLAWLGPGIGPRCYEVSNRVRDELIAGDPADARAFRPSPAGRWLADLFELARRRLRRAGVEALYGGDHCTYGEPQRFYSYRRDGATGRMATIAWIADGWTPTVATS